MLGVNRGRHVGLPVRVRGLCAVLIDGEIVESFFFEFVYGGAEGHLDDTGVTADFDGAGDGGAVHDGGHGGV